MARNQLALAQSALGQKDSAEKLLRQSVDALVQHVGLEHRSTATAQNNLAFFLTGFTDGSRFTEALALYETASATRMKLFGASHFETVAIRGDISELLTKMGRTHEAQSLRHDILKSVGYSQADIDAAENAEDADETAESVIAADSEAAEQQQATAAQTA
eukprot:19368-Heterococcus_DN1.PRE.4